jgi:hypothetical protein
MEEVLNRQLDDSLETLGKRAAELLAQLGSTDYADPAKGPSSDEIAPTIQRTLTLPVVASYRASLVPEFNVYAALGRADGELACTAGICDAVAYENNRPAAIFDWKSDVSPSVEVQRKYVSQLQDYLEMTCCAVGYIVYVSSQSVREVCLTTTLTSDETSQLAD